MGLSARNAGGSAVSFENENGVNKRRIIFHKPHPGSKLEGEVSRLMITRMQKWFGWQKGSVLLAS